MDRKIIFIFLGNQMDDKKLQPYLDRVDIVGKFAQSKRGGQRWYYIMKIGDKTFDYYGSQKDYEDELNCKETGIHKLGTYPDWKCRPGNNLGTRDEYEKAMTIRGAGYLDIKLKSDDDVKRDFLYAIINDLLSYEECNDEYEFAENYVYSNWREAHEIRLLLEINYNKIKSVLTNKEIEELKELYQDY